jgi:small subunit ribosomal protein S20
LANIKSQIKRNKQNEKRRLRNRTVRGSARTAVKAARIAMSPGADAKAEVTTAISALDRAAGKGGIHPRNAARRKSRLMKAMAKAASLPVEAADKKKIGGKKK